MHNDGSRLADSPPIELTILIEDMRWAEVLPSYEHVTIDAVNAVILYMEPAENPISASIILADDEFLQGYNYQYRGKNYPTNVLSFPGNPDDKGNLFPDEPDNLGDIMISLATIEREAIEQHKSFENHYKHMLVHGVLHLMGYDHENDQDAEVMESLEIEILQKLGVQNPYEQII